jgi:hypothetical protein
MAVRKSRRGSKSLNTTAESIGAALGHVAARLDAWKRQRAEISADIQQVLRSAHTMLGDLGHVAGKGAREMVEPFTRKGGRPKGYKMSESTKRKLRAAWKRRKAARAKSSPSKT